VNEENADGQNFAAETDMKSVVHQWPKRLPMLFLFASVIYLFIDKWHLYLNEFVSFCLQCVDTVG